MSKKDDNLFCDILRDAKSILRHRKSVKLLGREFDCLRLLGKTYYLDNEVPAAILDTFDNLGFVTKDLRRPATVAKCKTAYGWHMIFRLPPGISCGQVADKKAYFQDATNSWITITWRKGLLHMDIQAGEIPELAPYEWGPDAYKNKMDIPVPVGVSRKGLVVADLARGPHWLIGGETGYGKSTFVRVLVHSVMPFAQVAVVDLKGLDFYYLRQHCLVVDTQEGTLQLLQRAVKEYERRKAVLQKAGVEKIQLYRGKDLPYMVIVIDEFAEIRIDQTVEAIDTLVRLARAVGIHLVAATQRPSTKNVMPGDTRSQFPMRLCFPVADGGDSRMILGEQYSQAASLPAVPGRAIYRHGIDIQEVQTLCLSKDTAELMLQKPRAGGWWDFEQPAKRLLPR